VGVMGVVGERWDDAAAGQQEPAVRQRGPFGCHVLWLAATEVLSTDGHRSKVAGVGIVAGLMSDWVYLVGLGEGISISDNGQ